MIIKEEIRWKGAPILLDAVRVNHQTFLVYGNLIKTASLKKEWQEDIDNPDDVLRALKNSPARIDLLKFWQRIPETAPKYPYYKEWRNVAVIPVSTFEQWWQKQISPKARNKVRKAQKMGVVVKQVSLDDELIHGIMGVFNDSPVRRGKPFWHYGKDFTTVKNELSADLKECVFIGAYYEKELIGFVKFIVTDRYAMTSLILDKQSHRNKAPMNGMIAKVVEICAENKIPYFTYTVWRRGDHGHFQESNGFIKIPVPEYFVPLTLRGELALRVGLHKGIKGALPEKVMVWLLAMRSKWYSLKYAQRIRSRLTERKSVTISSL